MQPAAENAWFLNLTTSRKKEKKQKNSSNNGMLLTVCPVHVKFFRPSFFIMCPSVTVMKINSETEKYSKMPWKNLYKSWEQILIEHLGVRLNFPS